MNPVIILQIFALVCSAVAIIYYLMAVKVHHKSDKTTKRGLSNTYKKYGKMFAIIAIVSLIISYAIIFKQIQHREHLTEDLKDVVHSAAVLLPMSLIELLVDQMLL
jgi:NADH:ubiquinone oxidoreductase subunit 2 (subunit N)